MDGRAGIRRAGFTLVEVLVVVAIVAVLIGILLPALGRARAAAQQVRCASNLRQWGVAFHIYADQYKGLLPHTGDRENGTYYFAASELPVPPVLPGFTVDESGYTYVLPQLIGLKSWLDYPLGKKPTDGLWQCHRAAVLGDAAYGYAPSKTGYHSYAANQYLDWGQPTVTFTAVPEPASAAGFAAAALVAAIGKRGRR